MAKGTIPTKQFFTECGRRGGRARARQLSSTRRAAIAAQAARTRWKKQSSPPSFRQSVRLREARWDDPVYMEEILAEGSMDDWHNLYRHISDYPFGSTADTLAKVLATIEVYGVTPLWKSILSNVRGI